MTGLEYQLLAGRTLPEELSRAEVELHALFGMASELGEIHGLYQKTFQGHELDPEHLKKELGDLMWFAAEFCTAQGWTLDEVFQLNIEKLQARFPDGFEVDRSLNRKEGDI